MTSRTTTGCYQTLLSDIAKMRMSTVVEEAAIAHLTDAESEVARSAAEALGIAGSAASRAPLERAFAQWHTQWAGRADAFRYTQAVPSERHAGRDGETYLRALVGGAGWRDGRRRAPRPRVVCDGSVPAVELRRRPTAPSSG
jgi:hypothetical protein